MWVCFCVGVGRVQGPGSFEADSCVVARRADQRLRQYHDRDLLLHVRCAMSGRVRGEKRGREGKEGGNRLRGRGDGWEFLIGDGKKLEVGGGGIPELEREW